MPTICVNILSSSDDPVPGTVLVKGLPFAYGIGEADIKH